MSWITTIKRGNLGSVWDKPVPDRWLCFCPNFLSFCWSSLIAFGEFIFQKLVTNQLFELAFCAVRQDTFYPYQDYEQVNFYKKSSLYFIHWSFRNWKDAAYLQLAESEINSTRVYFFYQHSQPLYDVMQKENENLEFVQGVNPNLCNYWLVEKQRYKVLVNIWRFLWGDLQFKNLCWPCHHWETSRLEHSLH